MKRIGCATRVSAWLLAVLVALAGAHALAAETSPAAPGTPDEEKFFRSNRPAWADWDKRPPSYRRSALHWITSAKKPQTRAKRLAELMAVSAEGRRLPQYDWQKKP